MTRFAIPAGGARRRVRLHAGRRPVRPTPRRRGTRQARRPDAAPRQPRSRRARWSVWNEPNHPQFLGPALCLNARYRMRRSCNKIDIDGWAHHPYTTRRGPWYRPRNRDAVMIGTLSRLRRALDRAARAGAIRRRAGIYLTEFGIQSKPDPVYGVSQTRQAEWRAAAERIAYRNPRVRAFSQYLMRDDAKQGRRYGGFESGLRFHRGRRKKAYRAFRMPMTATRTSRRRVRLWGLVRPAGGRTRVTIYRRDRGGHRWRRLKRDRSDRRGYWRTDTHHRRGRSYLVRWREPGGRRHAGARTRVLRR